MCKIHFRQYYTRPNLEYIAIFENRAITVVWVARLNMGGVRVIRSEPIMNEVETLGSEEQRAFLGQIHRRLCMVAGDMLVRLCPVTMLHYTMCC